MSGFASLPTSRAVADPDQRWRNSLKPPGNPVAGIKFVRHGKSCGVILLPQQPTTEEAKAAAGGRPPLTSVKGEQNTIEIATADSLEEEGYEISVQENRILLSGGRTRGVINACTRSWRRI